MKSAPRQWYIHSWKSRKVVDLLRVIHYFVVVVVDVDVNLTKAAIDRYDFASRLASCPAHGKTIFVWNRAS